MGNRLLNLRGNSLGLRLWCRRRRRLDLLCQEVQRIDCLCLLLVSLGDDSRGVVAGVGVGKVLQSALRPFA